MNKQIDNKAIEELSDIIFKSLMDCIDPQKTLLVAGAAVRVSNELAEALYNAGYCKVDEIEKMKFYKEAYEQGKFDANAEIAVGEKVVISKEEYEILKFSETLCDAIRIRVDKNLEVETVRKETAREILQKVDYESNGQTVAITNLIRKQYGVEVE